MSDKKKSKSAAPKAKAVSRTKNTDASAIKPATKTRNADAKSKTAVAKSRKATAKTVAAPAAKCAPKTRKTISKTKEPVAKRKMRKVEAEDATMIRIGEPVADPIGDVSSGEAKTYLGDAEPVAQAGTAGLDETTESAELTTAEGEADAGETAGGVGSAEGEGETGRETRPPVKLERLQKILSQAGIASRRHAEEMIVAGRVMVNGQVVTTLGSKADPARDHIRVDGKLVQGAERHRYFVLNKPKGYVTTVSDPEGRPTVMDFVARARERLYPVGRLDYQSEGLLLMTNDGELANLLTKAGSGVKKTYLVKVAGQPSEEELERLRGGVTIEKGEDGSERVRTSPARIRPVREGDNPWYEVVLIEGRNRELRKMFSAVGHFVEKIRRVGYGPLVLDVEPGKLRELRPEEVSALRLTAEGKLKPKRMKVDRMLPLEARRAPEKRGAREDRPRWQRDNQPKKTEWRPREREFRGRQSGEFRGKRSYSGPKPRFERPAFPRRPQREQAKPRFERPAFGGRPRNEGPNPGFEGAKHRPFRAPGERLSFQRAEAPNRRFEKPPAKSFGARRGKAWTERQRTAAPGADDTNKDARRGRFESRGGAKGSGFSKGGSSSKVGGKGPGFPSKFGVGKSKGFRPPGKPGGGMKRG
jgi:23S rRNA pseudouridine2605 synthase